MPLSELIAKELKNRNNPTDMKTGIIGYVTNLAPLCIAIENGQVLLKEGNELIISEWFRFRCNIDKTKALSSTVPTDRANANSTNTSAKGVSEVHSATSAPCQMPEAISFLATSINWLSDAILQVNTELLQLKCELKVGDKMILQSTDTGGKYFVIDKASEE